MVVTDDDELYFRAFGYHDQGHFPSRSGVEVGNRSIVGQNYRMNEITGAVLIAQFRRLDDIIARLTRDQEPVQEADQGNPRASSFRTLNDAAGECNTLLTVLPARRRRQRRSWPRSSAPPPCPSPGWHVYNNMEQILGKKMITEHGCPYNCSCYPCQQEYSKGMLPRTDDILGAGHQHLRRRRGPGPGLRVRHPPALHRRGDRPEGEGVHHRAQGACGGRHDQRRGHRDGLHRPGAHRGPPPHQRHHGEGRHGRQPRAGAQDGGEVQHREGLQGLHARSWRTPRSTSSTPARPTACTSP